MRNKKVFLSLLLIALSLLLSGCAAAEEDGRFFHDYLAQPFITFIKTLGEALQSYGFAIIVITIILRSVLLPFALNTAKKQKAMREKMAVMKPELDEIQARLKAAKTKEEQMKIQQEMMALYQKHEFNPFAMGCLPMLLQIPIWMGLYYAIRLSPEISEASFLWFNLGETDIVLAVIAGIAYYLQFQVSMKTMPQMTDQPQQQQMMKMMGWMSPVMIFIASISTASALALYWVVSGIYLIGQLYLQRKLYPVTPAPVAETSAPAQKQHNHAGKKKKKKRK